MKIARPENMSCSEYISDYFDVSYFKIENIIQADQDMLKLEQFNNFLKKEKAESVVSSKDETVLICDICSVQCMTLAKLVQHKKNHQYSNVINHITHQAPLCILCLKNGSNIISLSDSIFSEILNDQGIPIRCQVAPALLIKEGLNVPIEDTPDKAQVCESCINHVVKIYNFRKMLQISITNFKLIVKMFDEKLISTSTHCEYDSNFTNIYIDTNEISKCEQKDQSEEYCHSDSSHRCNDDNTVKKSRHRFKLFCAFCNKSCSHKDVMRRHVRKHRKTTIAPICEICGEIFSTKDQIASHKLLAHNDCIKCEYCKNSFTPELKYKRHIKKCELKVKPYACDFCYTLFGTQFSLKAHRRRHFPRLHCQFCSESFWKRLQLTSHMKKFHNSVTVTTRIYPCTKCTLDFTNKTDLANHFFSHAHDDKYRCRVCNDTFELFINFKRHRKIGHNAKEAKAGRDCPVCGMTFSSDYQFARHVKTHPPNELKGLNIDLSYSTVSRTRVICDVCGKTLHNKYSLALHLQKHKARADCDVCSKYALVGDLKKHHKAHGDGNRQYYRRKSSETFSCDRCAYVSQSKAARDAHVNRHHLNVRPFKCDVCGKAYYSNSTLTEHKTNTHAAIKKEVCLQCGARFSCRKSLKLHTRLHTGETPYKCDQCGQCFLSTSRLQEHIQRTHRAPKTPCPICSKLFHYERSVRAHIRKVHERESRRCTKQANDRTLLKSVPLTSKKSLH